MDVLVHPRICLCLYLKNRRLAAKLRSATFSEDRGGKKAAHSRTYPGQNDKAKLPADCQEPLQGLRFLQAIAGSAAQAVLTAL